MVRTAVSGLFLLFLFPCITTAQQFRATVTGTVTDAQGAVVPGVTVTALNTDTNVSVEAQTNERGVYTIQQLSPGPVQVHRRAFGLQDFRPRGHHASHRRNRHRQPVVVDGRGRGNCHRQRPDQQHRVERVDDRPDD